MRIIGCLVFLMSVSGSMHAQEAYGDRRNVQGEGDQEGRQAAPSAPQGSSNSSAYVAITPQQRMGWIVAGVAGPASLGVGVISSGWETIFNNPQEWGGTWTGFGKRYLAREADVAISNSLEAGVGSLWGEEPRYIRSHSRGFWPRTQFAMKTVLLAQRPDGHLAPAWGRYVGNTVNNIIENAWLPPSVTTPGQTALRSAGGFVGRLVGNVFDEFWPDAQRWLRRRRQRAPSAHDVGDREREGRRREAGRPARPSDVSFAPQP